MMNINDIVWRTSFWVRWLHKIPHLNLSLNRVNSTFNPYSKVYQESMGIIGSVPAFSLILTLFLLLIYLLTRCCDNRPRKPRSITWLKVTCVLTAFLTMGALGVSIWANEEVHNGITESIIRLSDVNTQLSIVYNKTKTFDEMILHNLNPALKQLRSTIYAENVRNNTVRLTVLEKLNFTEGNITQRLMPSLREIKNKVNVANLSSVVRGLSIIEHIRWIARMVVTILLMMVVAVVPIGVARHSRRTLIIFSVLGLISLIICWALTSFYIVLNVSISDWCLNPTPYLELELKRYMASDVVNYYLQCEAQSSPFSHHLTRLKESAVSINSELDQIAVIVDDYYNPTFIHQRLDILRKYGKQSSNIIDDSELIRSLHCSRPYKECIKILDVTCTKTISGFVNLLFSSIGSGFLFTLLVWFTSHTWIYLNNKSDSTYHDHTIYRPERNAQNQYINSVGTGGGTRPRHSHTPPQTPPFPSTMNNRGFQGDSQAMNAIPNSQGVVVCASSSATNVRNHNHQGNSHHHHKPLGPNQGQYATLSKQCKTLESSDFY